MFFLRNVFCIVILLVVTYGALDENYDTGGDIVDISSVVRKREKRDIDVGLLLRNLLLQSAQASDFKANLTRAKVRVSAPLPRPNTRRPQTMARLPAPRRMQDPILNLFSFKNQFVPFNPIDYGEYDDTIPSPQPPAPSSRPQPVTTMPPPTSAASQSRSQPQPTPRRRQPPSPTPAALPIHRFGNLGYNHPFSANYGYYQYPNQGLGSDYDYEQYQPPAVLRVRRPNSVPKPRKRPAPKPPTGAPPAELPAEIPANPTEAAPPQLRNRVAYQYVQPADHSYDEIDSNVTQDDAFDYSDVANADEDNATISNSVAANADANVDGNVDANDNAGAEPSDDSDNTDDSNAPANNDGGDDATDDDQSTVQLPLVTPRRQQKQQQDFASSNFGAGINGGFGSSSLPYEPPSGSYEFRNQFANFKTSFDSGYEKPTYSDNQYYPYYR